MGYEQHENSSLSSIMENRIDDISREVKRIAHKVISDSIPGANEATIHLRIKYDLDDSDFLVETDFETFSNQFEVHSINFSMSEKFREHYNFSENELKLVILGKVTTTFESESDSIEDTILSMLAEKIEI